LSGLRNKEVGIVDFLLYLMTCKQGSPEATGQS
jgi:hypothetical protein